MHGPLPDGLKVEDLIPHCGLMVLLDNVTNWDNHSITCESTSHQNPDNPLKKNGLLPASAGIEYAAQAIAAHGTLCSMQQADANDARPQRGYLAVLRKINWNRDTLSELDGKLLVNAKKLVHIESGSHYQFSISNNEQPIVSGEAIVALEKQIEP